MFFLLSINLMIYSQSPGILGERAPLWDIAEWIDESGDASTLQLSDFAGKTIYLFCFQSWCPGCHSHGFPTLKYLKNRYKNREDIVFLAVQTVFEGHSVNNRKKLRKTQKQYKLNIPFGHDPGDHKMSNIVKRYKTGGTPWIVIINPEGTVIYNDYEISPQQASRVFKSTIPR